MLASSPDPYSFQADPITQPRGEGPVVWPDLVYGSIRIAAWAAMLLATPPFARLADLSLSDVPGIWLFNRPFPSRLDHTRGVYHLARHARPRDRMLQAAALAHDLGHGPFSHVSEPVMRTLLGCNHEERAARQLAIVRSALNASARRRLEWLNWDEVGALVLGGPKHQRGALLNGRLDYDNIDHVARFSLGAGLGRPEFDGVELARALRLRPHDEAVAKPHEVEPEHRVYLLPQAEAAALAWRSSRRVVYGFLHGEHHNLAPHAMLRRMIELAALLRTLPAEFLDMSDSTAIGSLARNENRGVSILAQRVSAGPTAWYTCEWEAELTPASPSERIATCEWEQRAEFESALASEAGLPAHDVIVEAVTSGAERALPPIGLSGKPDALRQLPPARRAPTTVHVFAAPGTPRDYVHRLWTAAERRIGGTGAVPCPGAKP